MKKLITLAAIVLTAVTGLISVCQAQPVDPTYWHYKQKKANWLFDYDTVRINCLRIDNKLAIDSLGRIWWLNNSAPTLGEMLLGNGTYYGELSIGSEGEILTVNSGTADWQPISAAIIGDPEGVWVGDADDGHLTQYTSLFRFDPIDENRLELFDNYYYTENTGTGEYGKFLYGSWQVVDATGSLSGAPGSWGYNYTAPGGSFYWNAGSGSASNIYVTSPTDVPASGDIWTVDIDNHTLIFKSLAELGGGAQNLSWDNPNHEVDIDGGGTSATIPLGDDDGTTYGLVAFNNTRFDATLGIVDIATDGIALGTYTTGSYAAGDGEAGNATGVACTDCVALGTETTGSYAAGDAEAGNATGVACTDCVTLTTETAGNYVTSVATTSPLSGGAAASEGATLTLTIADADANGSTKGAASFTDADFNATGGNISLDYANGQAGTGAQDGFIQAADFTTFNNKGYTLTLTGSQGTMTDGQTYFNGAITTGTSTTAAINQVPIPQTGTIVAIYVYQLTAGTLATGESSTLAIRLNNTTDVTVSSAVLNSAISSTWSATGLSQAVTAGDYIELKFTGATWSTNPSNVRWTAIVFIR